MFLYKIVIFLLLILLDLSASTYKWSAKVDKKTAYVNEAILLTYVCAFSDASELYSIDFNPVQDNEDFCIKLLKETQVLKNSLRVNTYEFLAYVKKEGPISFDFDAVMKQTTQESIDSTTNGHYDDSKIESFSKTSIKLLPLPVKIKQSPSKLVGVFKLKIKQEKPKIKEYEPYHLEILVEGIGNLSMLDSIHFTIDGVKVFTQDAVVKSKLTKDGEKGVWSQKFAFVGSNSFTIPEVLIEYFNVKRAQSEILRFDDVNVNVVNNVLKKEKLSVIKEDKSFLYKKEYLYYLLVFVAGFLLSKIDFNIKKLKKREEELVFFKAIKKTNSLEELCFLLVSKNTKKYEKIISKIDSKEPISLKKAKHLLLRDNV